MGEHSPIFPRSWGENSSSSRSKKEEKGCTAKGERVRRRARPALSSLPEDGGRGGGEGSQTRNPEWVGVDLPSVCPSKSGLCRETSG